MPTLPLELTSLIVGFAPLFSKLVFKRVQVLIVGAILSPGKRTVTAALRVCGLSTDKHFQNYHRVLSRARWSSLSASRILLSLLVAAFAPDGVLVMGLDDTIERRRGEQIKARGIYRDPVRSSRSHARQSERTEMALVDVARPHPVGRTHLGTAILDGAVPLRALLQRAWTRSSEVD